LDLGAQAAVAIENARLFQQSDFIAEMVHELRTPLASIRTASHLLMRKEVSAEKKITVTEIIDQESTRLIEMTSAFLDIARLESGRMQFRAENFDPQELISDCANLVRSRIEERGLELVLSTPSTFSPYRGDRDKIKQVILNLLTNAINYNRPAGKVTLKGLSANNELVISVADTGFGIAPEDLDHLFDKFYRSQKTEQTSQGTGLGLAICKKIVEAHNGFIEVQSQVNKGTQFTVHLPAYLS
jgi:two-component system phosphate regulon sensor histidine kinase PhoR